MLDNYLFFNGSCRQAMTFYQQVLGGQMVSMLTYGEGPPSPQHGAQDKDRIMHAHLLLDGRNLMASDGPAGQTMPAHGGFSLSLNYPSADEARQVFDRLADGGKVTMPMAQTFWIETFGMCTDRFGVPWMVGGGKPVQM
jgi:PhnB protein